MEAKVLEVIIALKCGKDIVKLILISVGLGFDRLIFADDIVFIHS